jgi:hypothetical protein
LTPLVQINSQKIKLKLINKICTLIAIWSQLFFVRNGDFDPEQNDPAAINHGLPVAAVVALPKSETNGAPRGKEEKKK